MQCKDNSLTPEQCSGARGMLRLSITDLSKAAGVSRGSIVDFERGKRTPIRATRAAIRSALEESGLEFIGSNGGGPGIRFRARKDD